MLVNAIKVTGIRRYSNFHFLTEGNFPSNGCNQPEFIFTKKAIKYPNKFIKCKKTSFIYLIKGMNLTIFVISVKITFN